MSRNTTRQWSIENWERKSLYNIKGILRNLLLLLEDSDENKRLRDIYQFSTLLWLTPLVHNRDSHSRFVANLSYKISIKIWLDTSSAQIAYIIWMYHDILHPPFGHRGEQAINKIGKEYGVSFNHDHAALKTFISHINKLKQEHPQKANIIDKISIIIGEALIKRDWSFDKSKNKNTYKVRNYWELDDLFDNPTTKDFMTKINREDWPSQISQICVNADRIAINVGDVIDGLLVWRFTIRELEQDMKTIAWCEKSQIIVLTKKIIHEFYDKNTNTLPGISKTSFYDLIIDNRDLLWYFLPSLEKKMTDWLVNDLVHNSTSSKITFSDDIIQQTRKWFAKVCKEKYFRYTAPYKDLAERYLEACIKWEVIEASSRTKNKIWKAKYEEIVDFFVAKTDWDICTEMRLLQPHLTAHIPTTESVPSIYDNKTTKEDFLYICRRKYNTQKKINDAKPIWHPLIKMGEIDFTLAKTVYNKPVERIILPLPRDLNNSFQITTPIKYPNGLIGEVGSPIINEYSIADGLWITLTDDSDGDVFTLDPDIQWNNAHVLILDRIPEPKRKQLMKKFAWYFHGQERTKEILEKILRYVQEHNWSYYKSTKGHIIKNYQGTSSWYGIMTKTISKYKAIYCPWYHEVAGRWWTNKFFPTGVVIVKNGGKPYPISPEEFDKLYTADTDERKDENKKSENNQKLYDTLPQKQFSSTFLQTNHTPNRPPEKIINIIGAWMTWLISLVHILLEHKKYTTTEVWQINIFDSVERLAWNVYNRHWWSIVGMANWLDQLWLDDARWLVDFMNMDPLYRTKKFPYISYDKDKGFDGTTKIPHNDYGFLVKKYIKHLLRNIEQTNRPIHVNFQRARVDLVDRAISWSPQLHITSWDTTEKVEWDLTIFGTWVNLPSHLTNKDWKSLAGESGYYILDDQGLSTENLSRLDKNSTILIVWSGNGALFSALRAKANWFEGKITIIWRSGELPKTEKASFPLSLQWLTHEHIQHLKTKKDINKETVQTLFKQEMHIAKKTLSNKYKDIPAGAIRRSIIDALKTSLDRIMEWLNEQEKTIFDTYYRKIRNNAAYRVPNEHAQEIQKMKESWQLTFASGYNYCYKDPDKDRFIISTKTWAEYIWDMVINNTWPSKKWEEMNQCIKKSTTAPWKVVTVLETGGIYVRPDWTTDPHKDIIAAWAATSALVWTTIPAIRRWQQWAVQKLLASIQKPEHIKDDQRLWFHYSGFDHRPLDYATMKPQNLSRSFIKSRFGQSLTNINPRNTSPEDQKKYFTDQYVHTLIWEWKPIAPKDKTVLWSWWFIPYSPLMQWHPLWYCASRIIAEEHIRKENSRHENIDKSYEEQKEKLLHTVAMTDGWFEVLNPMRDNQKINIEQKINITNKMILHFVQNASWEVNLCVDDTDMDSFFRQHEVWALMRNHKITWMNRIVRNPQLKTTTIKKYSNRYERYQAQRDQRVDSIIMRLKLAIQSWNNNNIERMKKAFNDEYQHSVQCLQKDENLENYYKNKQNKNGRHTWNEITRENIRYTKLLWHKRLLFDNNE